MSRKILFFPMAIILLLIIQWQVHDFNVSVIHLFSTLFFFLINSIILFRIKLIYSTLITFIVLMIFNWNLTLHLFPRSQAENLGINFKSFIRVDTRFNNLSKLQKNDVVMINSIHGKFGRVVSLPDENATVNQRDWLGFFSKKQQIEKLNKNEITAIVGDTKIIIKLNESQIVGKVL